MLKRLKSVSMLLFLMGASTGAAYAVANPGVTDVKITQQSGTCTGVVKDATGETVVSIRPRACFFPLFSFLPLWLHYNLNPLCVQY